MRTASMLLPLLLCASPAIAQATAPPTPAAPLQVPPELTDPATADKLARVMQAVSQAFLNLPVGEVEAAVEGRRPTPAEKRLTVRDIARRDDPKFDRDFQQQIANAKPVMEQSMKALGQALPQMLQGLSQAQQSLERAVANLPDPTYPKR